MILDGVCYSAFIQFCGVILSRMGRALLYSVFNCHFLVFYVTCALGDTYVSRRL